MNSQRKLFVLALWVAAFAVSGCMTNSRAETNELDSSAFKQHFAAEKACQSYINEITDPAVRELSKLSTIGAMRRWIEDHPTDAFASLAQRVGRATNAAGEIDPRREKDQILVASHILDELKDSSGRSKSACGPNVRDHLMESLYLGLGGKNAKVIRELQELGVSEISEQRWTLLVSLLADKVLGAIY